MAFNEGDIFYTAYDGRFHVYKLLRKDEAEETFHVLGYQPVNGEPTLANLGHLEVHFYHSPIHSESFTDATFLANIPVTDDELIGYHEYTKLVEEDFEASIHKATERYKKAYQLTDENKLEEAIAEYSLAINILPTFYEAIDNRAFCKMDLGRWWDAIEDFRLSLNVNPDSLLAQFSLGECYYRMGEFAQAKLQFEKCVKLDPSHLVSKDFLQKTIDILNSSDS